MITMELGGPGRIRSKYELHGLFSLSVSPRGSLPRTDDRRCIDKVEMVEEIVYDDVVQCDHSYDKRCHTTYVTNYLRLVFISNKYQGLCISF